MTVKKNDRNILMINLHEIKNVHYDLMRKSQDPSFLLDFVRCQAKNLSSYKLKLHYDKILPILFKSHHSNPIQYVLVVSTISSDTIESQSELPHGKTNNLDRRKQRRIFVFATHIV